MNWILKALATGIISFVATNIDDIFVLTLFFGQANKQLRRWHVVAGQYIGFFALLAISLIGYFARLIVPPAWIGILGFAPIILGIRAFVKPKEEQQESQPATGILSVAAATFANGGDNVGIYTPLFANSSLAQLVVMLAVFLVMLAVWCVAGYYIGSHPAVQKMIDLYGHIIVPFVLIGLGIYIIIDSGTLALFGLSV